LKAAAEGKVTSPAALDVPALAQQLGKGSSSGGQSAKGKPTTRQIHLAYRTLEAYVEADEGEAEKDVKELGQTAARLAAVRVVLQQVQDEGDVDPGHGGTAEDDGEDAACS
jgi:hypothetical protein